MYRLLISKIEKLKKGYEEGSMSRQEILEGSVSIGKIADAILRLDNLDEMTKQELINFIKEG